MNLRILHTADNHIGLSFNQYPEPTKGRLIEERFASPERMVANVNEQIAEPCGRERPSSDGMNVNAPSTPPLKP